MASSWVTWRRQVGEVGVEHGRERVVLDRRILFEDLDLLERRAAPIDEVIGAMGDAGGLGPLPVCLEARVRVATLGRLDPREFDAAAGDRVPVNIPLELRHVDAVDRVVLWLEMAARRDIAREDRFRFQRAVAAATRDKRGYRNRRTANGPGSPPLEPREHSPFPRPFPRAAAGDDKDCERTAEELKLQRPRIMLVTSPAEEA